MTAIRRIIPILLGLALSILLGIIVFYIFFYHPPLPNLIQQNLAKDIILEKGEVLGTTTERFSSQIKILALGDIMLDRGVARSVSRNSWGDFSFVFSNIPDLKGSADILMANLEGPVSDGGEEVGNLYSFRMSPQVLPVLKSVGFDLLSVANNHMADWGKYAFLDTLDNLFLNNISYTGGSYDYASATEPTIIEKNGLRVGFLGFSDVGPVGLRATSSLPGILLASDPNFSQIISRASKKVDVLVVSIHWGEEYQAIHNSRQEFLAHQAVEAGAKLVLGHHPHVIQDDEWYKSGYIAYSLGNFVFDQNFSTKTMQGLALQLEIGKDGVLKTEKRLIKLNSKFQPQFREE